MDAATSFEDILEEENLRTFFQPIVSFNRNAPETYAVEALTRGPDGSPYESALDLFEAAEEQGSLYPLERVARKLAIRRFSERFDQGRLFMNLDANVIYDDSFRRGNTVEYMKQYGVNRDRIVFEITERNHVRDREAFEAAIRHYRDQGFSIAVDDVGSGYSNLDKIARLQPDFIKIDRSIISELNVKRPRYQLVETIITFAENIGSNVIAEGIENRDELQTLLSMGIEFGQGFFLARPNPDPLFSSDDVRKIHDRCLDTGPSGSDEPNLAELARPSKTVDPGVTTEDVYRYLEDHPQDESVVVLEEERPVGLLMRDRLHRKLSTNMGQSLYWNRSVTRVMDDDPLVLTADTPLSRASDMVINRRNDDLYDEVVVTDPEDGSYRGNVTVRQLLDKITKFKTKEARRANPLTGLPGNVEIQDAIQKNLDGGETFALIYADLDHFKPFNDYYGFERGDQAILLLKNVLEDGLTVYPHGHNFLGHVGGDDFVVVTAANQVHDYCGYVIDQFDDRIPELYDREELDEGVIRTENRNGEKEEFNLMTVSLAAVMNRERSFENHLEMSEVAAEVKSYVKRNRRESSYEVDRRS